MKTNRVLVLPFICLGLVFTNEQIARGDEGELAAIEPSRDGFIKKLVLPLRLSAIISTTATAVVWSKYYATHKDYMDAAEPDKISEYYDRSNKYYKLRNGFVAATGLLWGANLALLLLSPPAEVDEFAFLQRMGIYSNPEGCLVLRWSAGF